MTAPSLFRRAAPLAALLAVAAPALGGCVGAAETTGSTFPSDFRDRHPIVIADLPRTLDVFVEGRSGFDARQRQDLAAYLAEYRRLGSGALVAQVPVGTENSGDTRAALARIRSAAGGRIATARYEPADLSVAAPIRLTFHKLGATVGSTCGLWPEDMGVSDGLSSNSNRPYWNHGCAMQSNFAAQIADPVDLVRGRQETRPDTGRRMYNIDRLRQGGDPSTQYNQQGQSVRSGVSQ